MSKIKPVKLPLVQWPDPILSTPASEIIEVDESIKTLALNMLFTMMAAGGIGLAGPQVNQSKRIIVINATSPEILINPKIVSISSEMFECDEGCLSVPGYFEKRQRSKTVVVEFVDGTANHRKQEFCDLDAFVIQHEIDHLDGKVFVEDLPLLKQQEILSTMQQQDKKQGNFYARRK